MGVVPERPGQPVEELRGDYVEMGRQIVSPGFAAAAGPAANSVPLYLDGRVAYASTSLTSKGDSGAVLRRLQLVFVSAVTANGTNYWTMNVNRYNAGSLQGSAGALGSIPANTQSVAARTPFDVVNGTLAGFYLQPGDYLELLFTNSGGSGMAVPPFLAVLEFARLGV